MIQPNPGRPIAATKKRRHNNGYAIGLPIPLSGDTRARVEDRYSLLCKEIERKDVKELAKALPKLLNKLAAGEGRFRSELARSARALFDAYVRHAASNAASARLSELGKARVIGALRYLCNPNDVIPDYLGIEGFIDDAHVLNVCIRELKNTDPLIFELLVNSLRDQK